MHFKPVTALWEITRECNMQCIHCGSVYASEFSDELTTYEAFMLCDKIGKLGISTVTLSGGEPTTRPDWDLIALRLYINGVIPNILSNGWNINESVAQRAARANIKSIAIKIDGLEETHDEYRRPGSYKRIINAFKEIKKTPVHLTAVTTINRRTAEELTELLSILEYKGVEEWVLHYGEIPDTMTPGRDHSAYMSSVDTAMGFVHKYFKKTSVDLKLAGNNRYDTIIKIDRKLNGNNDAICKENGYSTSETPVHVLNKREMPGSISLREFTLNEIPLREIPVHENLTDDTISLIPNCQLDKSTSSEFCVGRCR
jgi:molybdenum cofactor biosynthesis enzyme MoaA